MKKIVFLYIIIAVALLFASCSDDDSTTSSTAKYVTINLQIGTDSTLNISGGSTPFTYSDKEFVKGKTFITTRGSGITDFVPVVPTKFKAYLLASEDVYTSSWQLIIAKDDVIDSVTVHTGSNYISVPKYKYKIYVTNYSNGTEMNKNAWYNWPDALAHLPAGSTTLYLYGKNDTLKEERNEEHGDIMTGEVKMINPYAAVCVYNNNYVTGNPSDWSGTTALSDNWYYLYKNCSSGKISLGMKIPITYLNSSGHTVNRSSYIYDTISANYIYQYIIDDN